jgi:hypothetical protein
MDAGLRQGLVDPGLVGPELIREQTLRARQKLVSRLPVTGELLRGSLLERTVRHSKACPNRCAVGSAWQRMG